MNPVDNRAEKTVLITGSSRGIGRAIAVQLAREGYRIVIHGRQVSPAAESTLQEIAAMRGVEAVRLLTFDIADRDAAAAALQADISAHGAYYGVVCNAGLTRDGAFPALSGEDWDAVLRTNLDG